MRRKIKSSSLMPVKQRGNCIRSRGTNHPNNSLIGLPKPSRVT
jgi:hypothetical protein